MWDLRIAVEALNSERGVGAGGPKEGLKIVIYFAPKPHSITLSLRHSSGGGAQGEGRKKGRRSWTTVVGECSRTLLGCAKIKRRLKPTASVKKLKERFEEMGERRGRISLRIREAAELFKEFTVIDPWESLWKPYPEIEGKGGRDDEN